MNDKYLEAVKVIKTAILRSQSKSARYTNKESLSLYYSIGGYVSNNSREGTWGTGAIDEISVRLREELPGLRGFSAANIKLMRQFYEAWQPVLQAPSALTIESKSIAMATDLDRADEPVLEMMEYRLPAATDFNPSDFTNQTDIRGPGLWETGSEDDMQPCGAKSAGLSVTHACPNMLTALYFSLSVYYNNSNSE